MIICTPPLEGLLWLQKFYKDDFYTTPCVRISILWIVQLCIMSLSTNTKTNKAKTQSRSHGIVWSLFDLLNLKGLAVDTVEFVIKTKKNTNKKKHQNYLYLVNNNNNKTQTRATHGGVWISMNLRLVKQVVLSCKKEKKKKKTPKQKKHQNCLYS